MNRTHERQRVDAGTPPIVHVRRHRLRGVGAIAVLCVLAFAEIRAAETGSPPDAGAILVPELRGLVFLPDRGAFRPAGVAVAGVLVQSLALLDTAEFRAAMRQHLGRPLTVGGMHALTREVVLYCREHDRPIVDVFVPEQNVSNGVVQVLVMQGRLGEVRVEGNRHFASERLARTVRTARGEVIASGRLLDDMAWLNQNPFRQVDLVYMRGREAGQTDIVLRTKDRFPLRAHVGYDDTGNELTGDERVQAGVNWGDAFGRDHLLDYQLSASPDFQKLVAHSGSYVVPLPQWRHRLTLFGSYAESAPELRGGHFSLQGKTWQVGARYRVPLRARGDFVHDLTAGFDFKRSNNDLAFGGTRVFAQSTDVIQGILAYSAMRPDAHGSTAIEATLALSPGGITAGNRTSAFRAARTHASPDYAYARLALERTTRLPHGLAWQVRVTGQLSTANLLGSEQLGLGGAENLRGYEQREANGDNGFIIVNELHGPAFRFASRLGSKLGDRLQPMAFVDYGRVQSQERLPGEPSWYELASAGLGFRYTLGANLALRGDYGWQLRDSGLSDGRRSSRAHLRATVGF